MPCTLRSWLIISNETFSFILSFGLQIKSSENSVLLRRHGKQGNSANTPCQSVLPVWKVFRVGPVLILTDGAASASMEWDSHRRLFRAAMLKMNATRTPQGKKKFRSSRFMLQNMNFCIQGWLRQFCIVFSRSRISSTVFWGLKACLVRQLMKREAEIAAFLQTKGISVMEDTAVAKRW